MPKNVVVVERDTTLGRYIALQARPGKDLVVQRAQARAAGELRTTWRRKGITQPGNDLRQRQIGVGQPWAHHPGAAAGIAVQDALEVVEELRQTMRPKFLGAAMRGSALLFVVKGPSKGVMGIVNLDDEIRERQLQLMGPQSSGRVLRGQVQPATQEQQNVGRLSDQLPAGLEERRREGRVLDALAFQEAPSPGPRRLLLQEPAPCPGSLPQRPRAPDARTRRV